MKSLIEYINESNTIELVSDGKERGFEYVDLGLPSGTMWATCNVGATKPEDDGLLFQFGSVDGYKYGDKNHKFKTNAQNLEDGSSSEYIPITSSGKTYKVNDILDLADDAAHVNMGGKWKMPTKAQYSEMFNNTTRKVETINGVKGMLFTSKINNKQLFIPFVGYWYNGSFAAAGSDATVWSSQVRPFIVDRAYRLYCRSSGDACIDSYGRSRAFSVRGVFTK